MIIPALVGARGSYTSIDRNELVGLDGSTVGEVTATPPLLVNDLVRKASPALAGMPIRQVLDMFAAAGQIFATGEPDGLSPDAFVRNASLTSGLPIELTRQRTIGLFPPMLDMMPRFVAAQSPGGLSVFDSHVYRAGPTEVGLVPRGRNVGFVMPGNHPSTHFMWLAALAMKIPVIVRPSADDVFTPYRLMTSLLEAGIPSDALAFVPGGHDLVGPIVDGCSQTVLFGGEELANQFAANPAVRVHGPGRSKVVVPAGADLETATETICRVVMDDAGRGCINASGVVVEGAQSSEVLCRMVAARLDRVRSRSPLKPGAELAAVRPEEAAMYDGLIAHHLASGGREITNSGGSRIDRIGDLTIMRPTVLEVPTPNHPLFGIELPFPFVVFSPVASRSELVPAARQSLAVVVAEDDRMLAEELLLEPTVDKVFNGGALSTDFDPYEPHEGYLVDFLFHKKAVRFAPSRRRQLRAAAELAGNTISRSIRARRKPQRQQP